MKGLSSFPSSFLSLSFLSFLILSSSLLPSTFFLPPSPLLLSLSLLSFPSSFLPSFLSVFISLLGELGQKCLHQYSLHNRKRQKEKGALVLLRVALLPSYLLAVMWFLLCVNQRGTHGARIKYYFWGCLWGCFHKRLALRLAVCAVVITFPMYVDNVAGHYFNVKSWGRTWRRKRGGLVFLPDCSSEQFSALTGTFITFLVLRTKLSAFCLQLAGT